MKIHLLRHKDLKLDAQQARYFSNIFKPRYQGEGIGHCTANFEYKISRDATENHFKFSSCNDGFEEISELVEPTKQEHVR